MLEDIHQPLDYLDLVPEKLYRSLVTHQYRKAGENHAHSFQLRCKGVLQLREQLLAGQSPNLHQLQAWLTNDLVTKLQQPLSSEVLLSQTLDNIDYTDDLILNLLNWLADQSESFSTTTDQQADEHKVKPHEVSTPRDKSPGNDPVDDHRESVSKNEHEQQAQTSFDPNNAPGAEIYRQLQPINQSFALQRQLGWDLSKGIQSTTDTRQLLALHKTIQSSPYLQSIIRLIGRRKTARYALQNSTGLAPQEPSMISGHQRYADDSVDSMTGVQYSDDIARMLSSEMALLARRFEFPAMKWLWHARRAERQLLSYRIRGVLSQHTPEVKPRSIDHDLSGDERLQQQGPMILCVDTSASMKGRPEFLAKAIALEAMRIAHLEKRDCLLFCFSGKDEIAEYDLRLESAGWQPLVEFISRSFHGGTDMDGVLNRAIESLEQPRWKWADFLIISDGRFKIMDNVQLEVLKRHKPAVRVFGLQVGQWHSDAFEKLCHQVFTLSNV